MIRALRGPSWWPLLAAFAWFAATIGARSFAVPDEGRYAGVAWSMVTSGDWLVPHLNGLPYFHKPPLFYWITAAVMQWTGPVEWAARIAPVLGVMTGATALYLFARRWGGERLARLALVSLATQVLVFIGAQFANLDMLVAGCIAATVLAFAHAALLPPGSDRPRAALAAGYLFAALGLLAKGLIGIVLPGGVIVAWLLLQRRWRILPSLVWWPGVLLFAVVAAPWFVLMQRQFPEFSWYFFYVQHFARFAQGGFNNRQPAYFYPVVLLLLAFPWPLWVFGGSRGAAGGEPTPIAHALRRLWWTWLLVVTVFFSLPQSKLVGYIFPATFPLALLAAGAFARAAIPSPRLRSWWRVSTGVAVSACVAAVAFGSVHPLHSSRAIGLALRQAGPTDRIVFVKDYWFDIPVYAALRRPVIVLDDWSEASVKQRDNWRKELADAGRFDPAASKALLLPLSDAPKVLCADVTTWVVGGAAAVSHFPMLEQASPVAAQGDLRLWRLAVGGPQRTRAGCTPAAGPPLALQP
jgi:4-amino-4-deoxy-L-arabinose transferase-like glycosyltransferase